MDHQEVQVQSGQQFANGHQEMQIQEMEHLVQIDVRKYRVQKWNIW
jgi:hypothetical protein